MNKYKTDLVKALEEIDTNNPIEMYWTAVAVEEYTNGLFALSSNDKGECIIILKKNGRDVTESFDVALKKAQAIHANK